MANSLDLSIKEVASNETSGRSKESAPSESLDDADSSASEHILVSESTECSNCFYRSHCVIRELMEVDIDGFTFAIKHRRPLHKGEHLYRQAAAFNSLYIVHTGTIKIYRLSEGGEDRVWGFHLPGEIVGTDGLHKQKYLNSAVALDTATVCEISLSNLARLFKENKSFVKAFLSRIYGEVLESQFMALQNTKPSEQQVAAFLVNLSNRYEKRHLSYSAFRLPMSRRDIASYLGMAVETLSRILTRFQERGWLMVNCKELSIVDKASLEALSTE